MDKEKDWYRDLNLFQKRVFEDRSGCGSPVCPGGETYRDT